MYKDFWRIVIKEYRGLSRVLFIGAVTLVGTLLEGINVGLLVPLLETMGASNNDQGHWVSRAFAELFSASGIPFNLGSILAALAVLVLIIAGLKYLRLVLVEKTTTDFTAWLRSRCMDRLLHADLEYFHREKLGTLTDTLTTQANRAGSIVSSVSEMIALLGLMIAYLIAAFLVTPLLAILAFGTALVLSFAMQYQIRRARVIGTTLVERQNVFQTSGIESLSGIQVIKSFALQNMRWSDFTDKANAVGESEYLVGRNRSQLTVLQEIVLFALIGALVFIGVSVLNLGIAVIVALLFILYRLMPRLGMFNTRRQQLVVMMASMRNVEEMIEQTSAPKITNGPSSFEKISDRIEFKNVKFSYENSREIIKDTTFTVKKGEVTAIAGASGEGKTTILNLILRFYDTTDGRILVDGVDLREFDLSSWRSSIGVVSQDIFLFNDSVAYNIGLDRPESTLDEIKKAAAQVYAHDFIEQLPDGYDTEIGDRGWNLSGGQRQRLALARAVLTKPQILILDEATSSLDSESEQLIQRYLTDIRGTCTMLVVAHRLATIQNADKIIVLQNGEIAEEGDWYGLLKQEGLLANYHKLQSWEASRPKDVAENQKIPQSR